MKKKNISLGFIVLSFVAILLVIPVKAKTEEFTPSEDAYIDNASPNNNYGASDYLHIGTIIFGGICVTYIKFQIPVNERRVLSASVSTYWYNFMINTWLTVKVGTADNGWSEISITWNNAPYYYYEIIATASITDLEYFDFDVLDYIPASGEFSIIIFEYSNTGESLQSDSSENDFLPDPPVLTIEYELILADYLPYIIGGVIGGIGGVGAIIGVVIYLKRKKRAREPTIIQKPLPKFCTNCGTPVEGDFCTNCGKPINKII